MQISWGSGRPSSIAQLRQSAAFTRLTLSHFSSLLYPMSHFLLQNIDILHLSSHVAARIGTRRKEEGGGAGRYDLPARRKATTSSRVGSLYLADIRILLRNGQQSSGVRETLIRHVVQRIQDKAIPCDDAYADLRTEKLP